MDFDSFDHLFVSLLGQCDKTIALVVLCWYFLLSFELDLIFLLSFFIRGNNEGPERQDKRARGCGA